MQANAEGSLDFPPLRNHAGVPIPSPPAPTLCQTAKEMAKTLIPAKELCGISGECVGSLDVTHSGKALLHEEDWWRIRAMTVVPK